MQITPLGTNGFFSSFGRQTMCFVVSYRETLIILDAGSGLFRLVEKKGQKLFKDIKRVQLYLTHYHLDHTFGFYTAFKLFKGKKATVYGRGKRKVFSEIAPTYFPIDYEKEHINFVWREIGEGKHNIEDYTVWVREQSHGGRGSLAFRLQFPEGKEFAYVTDSEPSKEGIDFVKEVDLLLHEHWLPGCYFEPSLSSDERNSLSNSSDGGPSVKRRDSSDGVAQEQVFPRTVGQNKGDNKLEIHYEHYELGHVTTVGAAVIAKKGGVGKLALVHHYPFADNRQLEKQLKLAQSIFSRTILASDWKGISY